MLLTAGIAAAQSPTTAFETVQVALGIIQNTNRADLHDYWRPRIGGEAGLAFPFYLGRIEAGMFLMPFERRSGDVPSFLSRYLYLGWGLPLPLSHRLEAYAGLHVGSFGMSFEGASGSVRDETELAAGLSAEVSFRFVEGWQLTLGARHMTAFTLKRFQLVFVAARLRYRFGTPAWLKAFLQ